MTATKTQKQAEAEVLAEIERRGLSIEYGSRPNKYVRITGPGVDVKAPKLSDLDARDLDPTWNSGTSCPTIRGVLS